MIMVIVLFYHFVFVECRIRPNLSMAEKAHQNRFLGLMDKITIEVSGTEKKIENHNTLDLKSPQSVKKGAQEVAQFVTSKGQYLPAKHRLAPYPPKRCALGSECAPNGNHHQTHACAPGLTCKINPLGSSHPMLCQIANHFHCDPHHAPLKDEQYKGCASARWTQVKYNEEYSEPYCAGKGSKDYDLTWYKDCCMWDPTYSKCRPKIESVTKHSQKMCRQVHCNYDHYDCNKIVPETGCFEENADVCRGSSLLHYLIWTAPFIIVTVCLISVFYCWGAADSREAHVLRSGKGQYTRPQRKSKIQASGHQGLGSVDDLMAMPHREEDEDVEAYKARLYEFAAAQHAKQNRRIEDTPAPTSDTEKDDGAGSASDKEKDDGAAPASDKEKDDGAAPASDKEKDDAAATGDESAKETKVDDTNQNEEGADASNTEKEKKDET